MKRIIRFILGFAITVGLIVNILEVQASDNPISKHTVDTQTEIKIQAAQIADNTMLGPDLPVLDYADKNKVIFHSYFGIFVYDLKNNKVSSSLDFEAMNIKHIETVQVSKNGTKIYIFPYSVSYRYCWNLKDNTLHKQSGDIKEKIFDSFIDNIDLERKKGKLTATSFLYSEQSIKFSDGSYGKLYNPGYYAKDITYIRENDQWKIFENEKKKALLKKQSDEYYQLIMKKAKKSKEKFYEYYSFFLDRADFAGICSLSKGIVYSDEKQEEMGKYHLVVTGEEIQKSHEEGCFKFYITVSNWKDTKVKNKEYVRYLNIKKDNEGWYADGSLYN